MRKYSDYQKKKHKKRFILTEKEMKRVKWTDFKIFVPTEGDRKELMRAFKYIHDSNEMNSDIIVINQLMHLYLDEEQNVIKVTEPVAYEWHNPETGHAYVDYIPHDGQDEDNGYTKTPLYK